MSGKVADAVGLDLAGAQAVEEAGREAPGDEGAGAGVVGMPDAGRPACREDGLEPAGDVLDGLVPADRREAARALGADALQRMLETVGRGAPDAVIGKGAFAAEGAPGDGV